MTRPENYQQTAALQMAAAHMMRVLFNPPPEMRGLMHVVMTPADIKEAVVRLRTALDAYEGKERTPLVVYEVLGWQDYEPDQCCGLFLDKAVAERVRAKQEEVDRELNSHITWVVHDSIVNEEIAR